MTYLSKILEILTEDPIEIDRILTDINKDSGKTTYVIDALKKGIKQGKIGMMEVDGVKNKYVGHRFYKIK